jgi:hypothetical protein
LTITQEATAAAEATTPKTSVKQQLIAARQAAQSVTTVDLEIPGYGGRLWGTFRALDEYSEVRAIIAANSQIRDDADRELYNGADTLLAASLDTYALLEDGSKEPLGLKLGAKLAAYLELNDPETDRQALIGGRGVGIFPGTMSVMTLFTQYDLWLKTARREVEEELEGNSGAPS